MRDAQQILRSCALLIVLLLSWPPTVLSVFSIIDQTIVSGGPFEIHSSQITNDSLYLFASKNFQSTFIKIDTTNLQTVRSYTFSGFITQSLPPMWDVQNERIYLIYLLYGEPQYHISSFNMGNISVLVTEQFNSIFEPGVGLVNSFMKSLYIPEEDMPLGNQLRQISIEGFNDTGRIVNLDKFGTITAKHQDPSKPYLFTVQYHQDANQQVINFNIVGFNLQTLTVEKTWSTSDERMFIYSSCMIPGANLLAIGLGKDASTIGVALFDLKLFQLVGDVIPLDPSLKQQGFPTRMSSNGKYLYFTTNNHDISNRTCLIWRVPLGNFQQKALEYFETPKEVACNVVMLESNDKGAYFATDLGQRLFSTN
jgi:hypothetical protein